MQNCFNPQFQNTPQADFEKLLVSTKSEKTLSESIYILFEGLLVKFEGLLCSDFYVIIRRLLYAVAIEKRNYKKTR